MKKTNNHSTFGLYFYRQPRVVRTRLRAELNKRGIATNTFTTWLYVYNGNIRTPNPENLKIVERVTGQKAEILFPI